MLANLVYNNMHACMWLELVYVYVCVFKNKKLEIEKHNVSIESCTKSSQVWNKHVPLYVVHSSH